MKAEDKTMRKFMTEVAICRGLPSKPRLESMLGDFGCRRFSWGIGRGCYLKLGECRTRARKLELS